MMMADALIDIPAIRRMDKLESFQGRRHSTGKVVMPSGGLTVLSRYLQASQGSCHDNCKNGAGFPPEAVLKIPRSSMRKAVAAKRGAGQNLERVSENNIGGTRKRLEMIAKGSPDSKIRESDDPVVINIAQTQEHHLENVEEDLTDRKNSEATVNPSNDGEPKKPEHPAISVKPSCEDPVDIEAMGAEGVAEGEENAENEEQPEHPAISVKPSCENSVDVEAMAAGGEAENESSREKNPQLCMKPSPDSESQKPVDLDCVEGEMSSSAVRESVLPEEVSSCKETDYAVEHAEDSKLKPQTKTSSCPSGKQNAKGTKRKEANTTSMTSSGVSGGRNKGDKKNVAAPSVSMSPKGSGPSVPSMNARTNRSADRSKKQENARQSKTDKLRGKSARRSDDVKGVSHLMDRKNVKKLNSEQAESANIPETTSYLVESNPENKPVNSDQNNVVPIRPSSPSKDKSMKRNQNRAVGRAPHPYEKKNLVYRPKGNNASGLLPSSSSLPGRNSLRPTPNGLKITQHNDTSTEHDKTVAEKQKSSSKVMYQAGPKRVSMNTSNNKHLPVKKLNFQRGKVTQIPVEDRTPRRLAFKKRELADNKNDDIRKGKVEDWTPKRLKFRQRVNVDNINGDTQNGKVEEFTPRRLKFRPRVDREGYNQKSRIEELSPRKLEYRRKLNVDNINGDNQNGRVEELGLRRLSLRRKLIVDNMNGDNQNGRDEESNSKRLEFSRNPVVDNITGDNENGRDEEFSSMSLEFSQKLTVDNINGDNQNGGVDEFSPRRLEFSRTGLDHRNSNDQNGRGEDSSPRKLVFRPKLVQNTKGIPSKNNSGGKDTDVIWDNATKIRSRRLSLRHRDVAEKKGTRILYNNIIEQTASRLARDKASKVKALVSAFETVISHLDHGIPDTNDEN